VCLVCLLLQLTKWFTWLVLPAFLFSAVFWVTRLNMVRAICLACRLPQPTTPPTMHQVNWNMLPTRL
jgi:hypothetical protein